LEELLAKGIEQGFIRPDIDVKILAKMRVNQVEMGFNAAIFPVAQFSTWRVQYQMLEHFNYGICTLKGHKAIRSVQKRARTIKLISIITADIRLSIKTIVL
jgi:hypothetical protein